MDGTHSLPDPSFLQSWPTFSLLEGCKHLADFFINFCIGVVIRITLPALIIADIPENTRFAVFIKAGLELLLLLWSESIEHRHSLVTVSFH